MQQETKGRSVQSVDASPVLLLRSWLQDSRQPINSDGKVCSNMGKSTFTTISTVLDDADEEELEHARPLLSSERLNW